MKAALNVTDEDMDNAAKYERDLRHDVMAHVHAFADRCPSAKGIIHLGCTSQDIVCNADLICIYSATNLLELKIERLLISLGEFAEKWRATPALGFTHYQPAQPTTVGRRACGWVADLEQVDELLLYPRDLLRGFKGATGTQASFLSLFAGDQSKVDEFEARAVIAIREELDGEEWDFSDEGLEAKRARTIDRYIKNPPMNDRQIFLLNLAQNASIAELRKDYVELALGAKVFPICGQTYSRGLDARVLSRLASFAAVLHKIATDIRLLSNRKELDEPFGKNQIGSSAMPYKRNPMKCERICGLTRFVMNLVGNAYDTAATQWLERTLDDSSNRRLSLPESFLALDGALDLMHTVASGLVVNEAMVRKNLMLELPFMATENILMEAVKAGGDRQDLHEKIRVHAQAAGHRVKQEGLDNDLIERLKSDPAFNTIHHMLTEDQILNPMNFIGRSVEQTERFLKEVVEPLKDRYAEELKNLGTPDRGV